jgi:hypothetical protein
VVTRGCYPTQGGFDQPEHRTLQCTGDQHLTDVEVESGGFGSSFPSENAHQIRVTMAPASAPPRTPVPRLSNLWGTSSLRVPRPSALRSSLRMVISSSLFFSLRCSLIYPIAGQVIGPECTEADQRPIASPTVVGGVTGYR